MTNWTNVHLIFCEGSHDAVFLNRILKGALAFDKANIKISEFPYPLAGVLKRSFETRAVDDLSLDLAKKFFLPDHVLHRDTGLVLIFNYGGSNRARNMDPFLANVFALLKATPFSRTADPIQPPNYKYTIFADADADGVANAQSRISQDLSQIGEEQWLSSTWQAIDETKAVTQNTDVGPVAAYIWSKWTEDMGTLEDIVLECAADKEGLQKTLAFLDGRFNWEPTANTSPQDACALAAKRLKAAFCVEGQRKKPGGSLAVVLDQTDLMNTDSIQRTPAAQDCLEFLRFWLI